MLEGVDISYANGNYQPGGESFIIINASRANVGLTVGSKYRQQVDTARAHGKEVGHYFFNGNIDPVTCANFFVDNLYDFRPGDVLVLDVEAEPGTGTRAWTPAQAIAFARRVKERTGQTIGIYLNKSLMNGSDWGPVVEFGCWLWIAYYADNPPQISHWPDWTVWQYTSAGGLDRNRAKFPLAQMSGGKPTIKENKMAGKVSQIRVTPDGKGDTAQRFWETGDGALIWIENEYDLGLLQRYQTASDGNQHDHFYQSELNLLNEKYLNRSAAIAPPIDYAALATAIVKSGGTAPTAEQIAKAVNDDAAARLKA